MAAAQFAALAAKAARLAATATTQDDANRWWARADRWADLADRARTNQED